MVLSWLFGGDAGERAKPEPFELPSGPFRFVALDVETANGDAASICQIGIACVAESGRISVHSTLVDPQQHFGSFNVELHGIDADAVRGAPLFPKVFERMEPLLRDHLIFQHSGFDRRAIRAACEAYGLPEPEWRWADSVSVARRAWPEFKGNGGHGLAHLKSALGLEFEHHDAGEDAKAAAMVVLEAERTTGEPFETLIAPPPSRKTAKRSVEPPTEAEVVRLRALTEGLASRATADAYSGDGTTRHRADAPVMATDRQTLKAIDNNLGAQVEIVEAEVRTYFANGALPTPHYAWRIAIILSRHRMAQEERQFLAAWCRHFKDGDGRRYADLVERARKKGAM